MTQRKITVRVTPEEYDQITNRADASNLSVNRYLIQCALRPNRGNEKKLSQLMGQLCRLQNLLQTKQNIGELQRAIHRWRFETLRLLGG